jgi:hypothetical protein
MIRSSRGRPARVPLVLALCAALPAGGCGRRNESLELEAPAAPRAPSALPVDRLLPGELAEGSETAFGLPLPRVAVVRGRFVDVVFAGVDVPPDRVANYVRQRVSADKVETGPAKTVFSRAAVHGQPDVALDIEVLAHGGFTELQVRKLSTARAPGGLSDEERWRAAGFKPDGTPLDPTHLH